MLGAKAPSLEGTSLAIIMRRLCCALAIAPACGSACRAEKTSGSALVRKCEAYLFAPNGRRASGQTAQDAAYCARFIDSTIAAARLAHEHRGRLQPNGAPPSMVDDKAYRAFAMTVRLGIDICLPKGLTTREVARQLRLTASFNRELLWTDELTILRFVLAELYPCKRVSL